MQAGVCYNVTNTDAPEAYQYGQWTNGKIYGVDSSLTFYLKQHNRSIYNKCIILSHKKTASPFFGLAVFGFLRINVGLTKPFIKEGGGEVIAKYH